MTVQFAGYTNVIPEVEAATRAVRMAHRPIDVGSLGSFSIGAVSGTMAAGLGAASPIFSFRSSATKIVLIKRVRLSAANIVAFTAGVSQFSLFVARGFTVSDSGGANPSLANDNQKRRSSFSPSTVQDVRVSTTGALTAGTRTKDANPFASIVGQALATAGSVMVPATSVLIDCQPGEWPLVLAPNEGFVIEATVPATGTWVFAVSVEWDEVDAF